MSRRFRVWNSVRHAQAQGLARRIFSAASRVPATVRASKQGRSGGKKPSKMIQNSQQNGPKSRSGGGLGGPWAPLGRLLGGSWLQGTSGPPLGGHLGSSWAVLEPSWASLGRLLGRPGHQVGASWGVLEASWPQLGRPNPPKSLKNRCQDAFHLGIHFLIDF